MSLPPPPPAAPSYPTAPSPASLPLPAVLYAATAAGGARQGPGNCATGRG
ncbi:hypothetical protein GA0115240_110821, partial [Streptomyces sp. DvalAA-14]